MKKDKVSCSVFCRILMIFLYLENDTLSSTTNDTISHCQQNFVSCKTKPKNDLTIQ